MKPYGVKLIECPDVADIQAMASKSSAGRCSRAGGDYHGYSRTAQKAVVRRFWARKARREGVVACNER